MPELRKDPVVGRWVIIAHERAKRPHDFKGEAQATTDLGLCPFCEGQEDTTPPEIIAYRERGTHANGPGWRVRVVPNKFPALKIEGSLQKRGDGIYDRMAGIGAHEVIIENPASCPEPGGAVGGQHPRGPVGVPRPPRGLEER